MLTPLDLNGKTFSKGFRGFDTDEVKRFMDQVSKDFERLYQDNVELKDTVEKTLLEMADDGTFMEIAEKYADYGLVDSVCLGK